MSAEIPEALKADVPKSTWGKILVATPVVMTVIATLLAGLASSEMTRAQYDRSMAAQLQSKAGDQWGYFQAKKVRSALQQSTLDTLQATASAGPLDAAALKPLGELDSGTLRALQKGELPEIPAANLDPKLKAALEAVEGGEPEADIAALLDPIGDQALADALRSARANARAFDAAVKPITRAVGQMDRLVAEGGAPELARGYTVTRLRFTAARYDAEADLNRRIAGLLELQVRTRNLSAERHRGRSDRFFYGMLAAQAAVIVATFSLAARQRSILWSLAAVAGLAAIAFAIYVYFYV